MSCQSCAQPSIEMFTQLPQQEFFANKKEEYNCQTQGGQQCMYTAQGEMVCSKGVKMSAPGGSVVTDSK